MNEGAKGAREEKEGGLVNVCRLYA